MVTIKHTRWLKLTGMVWLPWSALIADWASVWFVNLTNAQPTKKSMYKIKQTNGLKTDKSIYYTKNVYWIPPFLWDHHSWCQMGTTLPPPLYEVITLDGDKPLLRGHHSWWRHLVECYHLSSPKIWSDKIDGLWWEGAYKETTLYAKTWTMNIFLCKIFISLRK